MQSNPYAEFQGLLEKKAAELEQTLRDRKAIAVERTPDAIDEWSLAADREMHALALQSVTELLRRVRAAQQRMRDGMYGMCIRCDGEISLKRLRAVPWAERCVHCQEKEDAAESGRQFPAAA
jgi:DnaK suppressor protein